MFGCDSAVVEIDSVGWRERARDDGGVMDLWSDARGVLAITDGTVAACAESESGETRALFEGRSI